MIKVKNNPHLMKNIDGLVMNVDKSAYVRHMASKTINNKIESIETDISYLKGSLDEIQFLLKQLLQG